MIKVRTTNEDEWTNMDEDFFWEHSLLYAPLQVGTSEEYDYLMGMKLIVGKDYEVLMEGEESPSQWRPTHVKICLSKN